MSSPPPPSQSKLIKQDRGILPRDFAGWSWSCWKKRRSCWISRYERAHNFSDPPTCKRPRLVVSPLENHILTPREQRAILLDSESVKRYLGLVEDDSENIDTEEEVDFT